MLKQKSKLAKLYASDIEKDYFAIIDKWRPEPLLDVEKAIIGTLLFHLSEENILLLEEIKPEDFYDDNCRRIFKTIQSLKLYGKFEINIPLAEQVVDFNRELSASDLVVYNDYLNSSFIDRYVAILKQASIKRAFYATLSLAPRIFNYELHFDDFLEEYEKFSRPLFEVVAKHQENRKASEELKKKTAQENFVPHYIIRGEEKYKVLQSKYEPYDGYVWIDGKSVKENRLLNEGFKIVYE